MLAAVLTVGLLVPILRLWKLDLRIPYNYSQNDANAHQLLIKATLENGWYEVNPDVGAPQGQNLHAFPMPDNLHLAVVKVFGWFTNDSGVVYNLYYLLGYPLAAIAAAWAFRKIGVSRAPAVAMAVLYALLPYHFGRGGNGHLFLAAYFVVPPTCVLLISIARGSGLVTRTGGGFVRRHLTVPNGIFVLTCVVLGSASGYYTIFALILAVGAAPLGVLAGGGRRCVGAAGLMVVLLLVVQVANLSPDLRYRAAHPATATVAARAPAESELLAFKLTQIVLPIAGHRIQPLADLRARYDTDFPISSEGNQIPLGAVGACGFLMLMVGALAATAGRIPASRDARALIGLTLIAFLVGTVGGMASFVTLLATAQLRGWNRIVIFIGFFSLGAVGLALDRLVARLKPGVAHRIAFAVGLAAVTVGGALDQSTNWFVPDYLRARYEFQNDEAFVERIESALPADAMVFQLPYVPYPEQPSRVRMIDYDLLRGYMHSTDLRWSYGEIGTGDAWKSRLSDRPAEELIPELIARGFRGVWIDRFGYEDGAASIEDAIRRVAGLDPLVSRNGRLAFFDLRVVAALETPR